MVTLSLLQPVAALVAVVGAAAAPVAGCYMADPDSLIVHDTAAGTTFSLGELGSSLTALALHPDGTLLGATGPQLGTVDADDGSFTPTVAADGDVQGLAYDGGGTLHAVLRVAGGDDEYVVLDPATGTAGTPTAIVTSHGTSSGVGSELTDVAVDGSGSILVVESVPGGDLLWEVTPGVGATSVGPVSVGGTAVEGIVGLASDTSALWASTTAGTLIEVVVGGASTVVATPGGALHGIACGSATASTVSGTVFVDEDRDGILDPGEAAGTGLTVSLQRSGTTVQTTTTDATTGAYTFTTGVLGDFTLVADVPAGAGVTTTHPLPVAVTAEGSTITGADIGYRFASVAGTVFDDIDGDGVLDAGEPLLDGITVTVEVVDGDGATTTGTATTGLDGTYLVDALPAGEATVTVPAADAAGPVAGSPTPTPIVFTLAAAAAATAVDLGYDGRGTIVGTVVNDLDGDAVLTEGEPALGGITVRVAGTDVTAVSADDGTYTLRTAPGDLTVEVVDPGTLPTGAVVTVGTVAVTVPRAETVTAGALGVQSLGVIGGRLFNDLDIDGTDDAGTDPGFAGTTVTLTDSASAARTTTTDATGAFRFTGLAPDTYTVSVAPSDAGDDLPDGLASTTGGDSAGVTLASEGDHDESVRFGYAGASTIAGTVFDDLDANGVQGAGELPLAGVVVLVDGTAAPATGATGAFSVGGLAHGDHTVALDPATVPAGATVVTDLSTPVTTTAGSTTTQHVAIDASVDLTGVVWSDRDADALEGTGEPGLAGVTVTVSDAGGTWTAVTDAAGGWSVGDLPRGTYDVAVTGPPPDGSLTTANATQTGVDATSAGETATAPIGYHLPAVGGNVFGDLDGDGVDDDDESGTAGATVTLHDPATATDVVATTTDAAGDFRFDEVAAGTYDVLVSPLVGPAPAPTPVTVTGSADGTGDVLALAIAVDLTGAVGDLVFNDLDGSGSHTAGEPGIAGVLVEAVPQDVGGTTGVTGTTDADGAYLLAGLKPGTYTVTVDETTLPPGAGLETTPAAVRTVAIDEAGTVDTADIGYDLGGSIVGTVWNDVDGDRAVRAATASLPAEPTYAGVTVELLDADGLVIDSTDTDASGDYGFEGLVAGTYAVRVVTTELPDPTATATTGNPVEVTLAVRAIARADVGFDAGASITAVVWNDLDGDGTRGAGEPALPDAPVVLTLGSFTWDGVTDAAGRLTFTDLVPETYLLDLGGLGAIGSPARTAIATAQTVTVSDGEDVTPPDFGVEAPVHLSGRIANDLAADGDITGDPGLAGVDVRLLDADGVGIARATVDPTTGSYTFGPLAPGTWTVEVDATTLPVGAPQTYPVAPADGSDGGYTTTAGPNEAVTGLDVGYDAGATIAGLLWDDLDGDGTRTADEPGLVGITVEAHDGDGGVAASDVTVEGGGFLLEHLAPGTYTVVVDEAALAALGTYVRSTPQPVTVTVDAAEDGTAGAIGYWRPATLTLTLFDDVDGSGVRDGDPVEPGVADRTVDLFTDTDGDGVADGATPVATATTDGDGRVVFEDLPPGDYVVDPDTPARHVVTTGNDPAAVHIDPDDDLELAVGVQAYAPLVTVTRGAVELLPGEAGDELSYPFRVQNDGNVADTYDLAATTDAAASVRIVAPDATGTALTTTGELAPGDGIDLVAIVTVPTGLDRGTVITTTVTVTGTTQDLADDVATGQTAVRSTVVMPVIGVTVDGGEPGEGYLTPGDTVPYTIEVSNGTAGDATVADALDVEVELTISPADAGAVVPGSITINGVAGTDLSFPLTLDTVAAGGAVTIGFDLAVARPLADGTAVTVTTTATATGNPEGDPRADVDATADTVSSSPLPEASLTADPPTGDLVEPGDTIRHTIVVGNGADATDTWRGVTLVADLPDTVTVASVTVDGVGTDAGSLAPGAGVALGDLGPGEGVTVHVEVAVADPVADATVITAVVEVTGDNGGPVLWATSHTVDARLGVTVGPDRDGQAPAATTFAHPHQLANSGNVTTVFDLMATTDLGWPTAVVIDANANGVVEPELGEVPVDTTPPLPGAGGPPLHLLSVIDVPAGELDGSTATTTLAAFSQVEPSDVPPAIAQAFAVTETVAPALVVDIAASPASTVVNRGQTVTYTTTVRNDGRAAATGVVLTDPTPADATYVSGSAALDGAAVPDGGGASNPFADGVALGDLAAGATRTATFQVVVGPVADGTPLIDVASVTADDDRSASGSVTQTVSASPVLDVALSSTPEPGRTVTAGSLLTYSAVVTNGGTLSATGVTLTQAVPDRTAYVPGSTSVGGTPVADVGGTSPVVRGLALGALAPGESRTVRLQVRVADPVFDGEEIRTVATVTSDQGVSATSVTLRSLVDVRPAASLAGGGSQDVARPGQAVYAHTVRNAGDVTDTFTLQARSSLGWRVSLVQDDDGDGRWDPTREITPVTASGPLPPGGSLRFLAVVEVNADAALGSADTTTVTARSVVDPGMTASTTSRTRATAPSLELAMSATPSGDRVNPGATITYVLSVRNRGAAPAADVVVTSSTPGGTTYQPDSATRDGAGVPDGTAADGNPLAVANGGVRIASIAPGGEVLVTFSVTVPPDASVGRVLTAKASVTAAATATATASKTHTVAPGATLDLALSANPSPGTATPAGTRITYTLAVRNTGQETAKVVRILADTPRDTTYVTGSTRRDGTRIADGRTDPNPLSSVHGGLAIGDLAPGGAGVSLTYAVVVDDPVPADALVEHRATALAGDATASSEELVHTVAVTPGATVTPDVEANAVPGGFADLAHTVTNTGDVTDAFALGATSDAGWVTSIWTDRDGDGDIEPEDVEVGSTPVLAPGEGTTLVVRVAVPAAAELEAIDVVRVTAASSLDPTITGVARDSITVVSGALRLIKTAAPLSLTPGARSTYTLTVRNVGTSPATEVVLTDAPPEGTRYVVGSTRRDGTTVPDAGGQTPLAAGLAVGTLAPDQATRVTFTVEALEDPGRTTIVNSATATSADAATARAGTVQPISREHGLDLTVAPDVTAAPGSTVVRPHVLSNTGRNADEVSVSATSSLGLPVAVHVDRDGDGAVGDGDRVVTSPLALAAGEQVRLLAVVHYTADVPEGAEDRVILVARSSGDPRVQVSVTDVIVVSTADVAVTLTATPAGDVAPGDRVTYEVVVTNRAETSAPHVVVTADTPAGTTYVPGTATLGDDALPDAGTGTDVNPLARRNGGVDLGALAAGATVRLSFVVEVDDLEAGRTVAAVAGVSIDDREPVASNTTRALVADTAGLQLVKSASPTAVSGAGEVVAWTITVMNLGAGEAREVVVTDPPAAGTRYLPGSATVDGRTVDDGLVTTEGLALGDIPPGGTRVVAFRTVLEVPGSVVQNVAAVRSAGSGARPLSNVAAVAVGQSLPATGTAATRTLGGAAALLVSGWMLLYLARPERQPVPVLRELTARRSRTRRRRTTE